MIRISFSLSLLLFWLVSFQNGWAQCSTYWRGILAGSSSFRDTQIDVYWENINNVDHFVVYYQDVTSNGSWQKAADNLKTTSYSITGLDSRRLYNVAVEAVCSRNGSSLFSFSYELTSTAFTGVFTCSDLWSLSYYGQSDNGLKVSWTDAHAAYYKVYSKMVDDSPFDNNTPDWHLEADNVTGLSAELKLSSGHEYHYMVEAYCRNGSIYRRTSTYTVSVYPQVVCHEPRFLTSWPSTNAATLGWLGDLYTLNERLTYTIFYSESGTGVWSSIGWNDPAINDPKVPTFSFPTINGLKSGTKYDWFVFLHCEMAAPAAVNSKNVQSSVSSFITKPLPPGNGGGGGNGNNYGACGCTLGSMTFNAALNNTGATSFYCDKITGASKVTDYQTVIFKAPVVDLQPGFDTNITGNGTFLAQVFDPNSCNSARMESDPSALVIEGPVAETTAERKEAIVVYPNPTDGILHVQLSDPLETILSIRITDMAGKGIDLLSDLGDVDMSGVDSGIYLYTISTNKKVYVGKFAKK